MKPQQQPERNEGSSGYYCRYCGTEMIEERRKTRTHYHRGTGEKIEETTVLYICPRWSWFNPPWANHDGGYPVELPDVVTSQGETYDS